MSQTIRRKHPETAAIKKLKLNDVYVKGRKYNNKIYIGGY